MDERLASLTAGLDRRKGAALEAIREREEQLGLRFPSDYVEFMLASNGGEGFVGESYVRIEPIEEVMSDDLRASLPDERAGLVVFGSNGALEAFAFDTRGPELRIVMFPRIGVDEEEVIGQGRTFSDFLERAHADALFDH